MADTLPIGISSTPIDMTSEARAFARSALESRLQEIAARKEKVSENEKTILKAMSVQAPYDLLKEQRKRYLKDESKLRDKAMTIYRDYKGEVPVEKLAEIEDDFSELESRYKGEAAAANQYRRIQTNISTNPDAWEVYDMKEVALIMTRAYDRLIKGEGLGDINAELAQAIQPQSNSNYLYKQFGKAISGLDQEEVVEKRGNSYVTVKRPKESELEGVVSRAIKMPFYKNQYTLPDGSIDENKYNEIRQEIKDAAFKEETEPYEPKGSSSSSSSSSAQELFPTVIETNRGKESWYNVPAGVPQTKKTITVRSAYDADTGKEVSVDDTVDYNVVSFSPEAGFIRIKTAGGTVKANGKPILYDPSRTSVEGKSLSEKRKSGKTQNEWKTPEKARASLIAQSTKFSEGDKEPDEIRNINLSDNGDGTWTLSGELVKKPNWVGRNITGAKEEVEKVSTTLEPITDKSVSRVLELDLNEYRGVLSPLEHKWRIGDKRVKDVLDTRSTGDEETVMFELDGETYEVPASKAALFIRQNPNAKRQ